MARFRREQRSSKASSAAVPRDPLALQELAASAMSDYLRDGDSAALLAGVGLQRLATSSARPGHPAFAEIALRHIRFLYVFLQSAADDTAVLAEIVSVGQPLFEAMPQDHPERPLALAMVGSAALRVGEETGDVTAARTAVRLLEEGCTRFPAEHGLAVNLGGALISLARLTRDADAHLRALRFLRATAEHEPLALNNLAAFLGDLLARPEWHPLIADFCRASVSAQPPDTPADAPALTALASLASAEYAETRGWEALRTAVAWGRRALVLPPQEATDRLALLITVSTTLSSLASMEGGMTDTAEALALAREAVDLADDEPGRPRAAFARAALGMARAAYHELTGDPEARRDAEHELGQALARLGPDDDSMNMWTIASDHATSLYVAAARRSDLDLLRKAVQALRKVCAQAGVAPHRRAAPQSVLAKALADLYTRAQAEPLTTLHEAVAVAEEAMGALPSGHPVEPFVLQALVRVHRVLGTAKGDASRLRDAIAMADRLLETTAAVSPEMAAFTRLERAISCSVLAELEEDHALAGEARAQFRAVAAAPAARLDTRLTAAAEAVKVIGPNGDVPLADLERAVELLRLNVASGPLWSDRELALRTYAGLAATIVRVGLAAGDPVRTIELLERGRGLLSRESLDLRGDLAGIRAGAPELAAALDATARELRDLQAHDRAMPEAGHGRDTGRELARRRAELLGRWTLLREEAELQAEPPFAADALVELAAAGPVVVVTTDVDGGGHALMMTGDPAEPVRVLPLPGLGGDEARERVLTFLTARHYATDEMYPLRVRRQAQAEVRDTLDWLWRTATEPILAALGFTGPVGESWPRLWWCPLGFLGYLPWHAAGPVDGPGALDRVVSSYAASLRALRHVRAAPPVSGPGRALIVAASEVPSAAPLHGVTEEVEALRPFLPDATTLAGPEATRHALLSELPRHTHVHLACHAMTDLARPSASRLLLKDHESAPLTVADLAALDLPEGELAVLSACTTSEVAPALTDEALHLTGAFQLSGFRHVIGALWPVSDTAATRITTDLYARLTGNGSHPPQAADAAVSLHHAVRALRETRAAAPTAWASFIHVGA